MMTVQATVEGTAAILLNRATEEALTGGGCGTRTNNAGEREDPRTIAAKAIYLMPKSKQIAFPGSAFARMTREAGSAHKAKGQRKSLKYIVPSAVIVLEELYGFYLKDRKTPIVDFEVDARPVTIPSTKGRVMRYRARLNEWVLKATLRINEEILAESMVRQLFAEGAAQIGLGDYRPEKGGPFGVSQIVEWKVISDAKSPTVAQQRNGGTQART